eukprot:Polyplicarium_translucidae@DN3132_c0_g1_i4.p1
MAFLEAFSKRKRPEDRRRGFFAAYSMVSLVHAIAAFWLGHKMSAVHPSNELLDFASGTPEAACSVDSGAFAIFRSPFNYPTLHRLVTAFAWTTTILAVVSATLVGGLWHFSSAKRADLPRASLKSLVAGFFCRVAPTPLRIAYVIQAVVLLTLGVLLGLSACRERAVDSSIARMGNCRLWLLECPHGDQSTFENALQCSLPVNYLAFPSIQCWPSSLEPCGFPAASGEGQVETDGICGGESLPRPLPRCPLCDAARVRRALHRHGSDLRGEASAGRFMADKGQRGSSLVSRAQREALGQHPSLWNRAPSRASAFEIAYWRTVHTMGSASAASQSLFAFLFLSTIAFVALRLASRTVAVTCEEDEEFFVPVVVAMGRASRTWKWISDCIGP